MKSKFHPGNNSYGLFIDLSRNYLKKKHLNIDERKQVPKNLKFTQLKRIYSLKDPDWAEENI